MVPSARVCLHTKLPCMYVCGMRVRNLDRRRKPDKRNIFQLVVCSFNLLPYIRVAENILFPTLPPLSIFLSPGFPQILNQSLRPQAGRTQQARESLGVGVWRNKRRWVLPCVSREIKLQTPNLHTRSIKKYRHENLLAAWKKVCLWGRILLF